MFVDDFFKKDFITYAIYDNYRSIASYVDGLKYGGRKAVSVIENTNESIKVSSLAAKTIDTKEYLHSNTSLEDMIVNISRAYPTSNNINIFNPKGDFGSRCITRAGSARYISVEKAKIFDLLFNKTDRYNLIDLEFEGKQVEPKFYIPTIPLILVNGSEGVGNGFAQKILPRNPLDIIKAIKNTFSNKTRIISKIAPYWKGFTGGVEWDESKGHWKITGVFTRVNTTTLLITELPIKYTLTKYNSELAKLEEKKIISNFVDKSEPKKNKFLFEVKVNREFMTHDDEWILNKLKLVERITENFTCMGENNSPVEFTSEYEILSAYCRIREQYYEKRKEHLLSKQNKELVALNAKYHFVKLIVENKIKVFKKTKAEIEAQIKSRKEFDGFEDLNMLLNLPIHSLSQDTMDNLAKQVDDKKIEIKKTEETTVKQMWVADLNVIEKQLKDF